MAEERTPPVQVAFEQSDVSTAVFTLLPGPARNRSEVPYRYRVIYRTPDPDAPGCVMLWEVWGGRLAYQIALERDDAGRQRLHCTCADAVFRAEAESRVCKHVRGLLAFGRPPHPVPR
jgi:hypothetical protein